MQTQRPAPLSLHSMFNAHYICQVIINFEGIHKMLVIKAFLFESYATGSTLNAI